MIRPISLLFPRWIRYGFVALLFCSSLSAVRASDLKLEALLVWGTNDEKSPDPAHKRVDPVLAKKLAALPFKWKNYFEINRKHFPVNDKEYTQIEMSKKCVIAVKDGGNSTVKVKMTGDGKEWHRQVRPLPKGETVIIGGDDQNQSAWLVVLRHAEDKKTEKTAPLPQAVGDPKALKRELSEPARK